MLVRANVGTVKAEGIRHVFETSLGACGDEA